MLTMRPPFGMRFRVSWVTANRPLTFTDIIRSKSFSASDFTSPPL